jgi:starch phosphorylase
MPESNGAACGAAEKVKPAASPASEEPAAIAGNISFHAQYSPHFSPLAFGPEQAFYSTAESVRDHLVQVREHAES